MSCVTQQRQHHRNMCLSHQRLTSGIKDHYNTSAESKNFTNNIKQAVKSLRTTESVVCVSHTDCNYAYACIKLEALDLGLDDGS